MLRICKFQQEDFSTLANRLAPMDLDYNTVGQAKSDLENGFLYAVIDDNVLVANFSLVPEIDHGYTAFKRLAVYRQNCGIADFIFKYICGNIVGTIGCTPWASNKKMLHLLDKHDFKYQFTVCERYLVYTREGEGQLKMF